jgi:hypothetical protein
MTILLLVFSVFAFSATAPAVDLNAEIPKTTPVTTRSEIERGMKAAPNPLDVRLLNYMDAFFAVENRNKQQNTLSEPFRFGLYYAMWHEFWQLLSNGFYKTDADRGLAVATVNIYFLMTMALQKRVGLSDEDIASVASITYVDQENAIFPEILRTKRFRDSYPTLRVRAEQFKKRQDQQAASFGSHNPPTP